MELIESKFTIKFTTRELETIMVAIRTAAIVYNKSSDNHFIPIHYEFVRITGYGIQDHQSMVDTIEMSHRIKDPNQ